MINMTALRRIRACHRLLFALPALLMFGVGGAFSSELVPLTLDDLVARAETIFVGQAVEKRFEWQWSGQGRSIVTLVTFKVERVLKGRAGSRMELEFLGGEIGDVGLRVAEMPEFRIGDRDVLFVSANTKAVSPLVGTSFGRFRIVRDPATGLDRIQTHNGRPYTGVAIAAEARPSSVARPILPSVSGAQVTRSLTSDEFQTMVQLKVAERAR